MKRLFSVSFFILLIHILPIISPLQAQSRSKIVAAPSSPIIESIYPEGDPIQPFLTDGDLWLNTWADDDAVYSGWGDGRGVVWHASRTDCGIAKFSGTFPDITAEERCFDAPTALPDVDDKPSSLLYLDNRLYGLFHSPLGDAWIGYLAFSEDYGKTWTRVGYYQEGEAQPVDASPWTRDNNSRFRCAFFINMGENYRLNSDGYVYAMGIGKEWSWLGGVYLARVKKEDILDYAAWEYHAGTTNEEPQWSSAQADAAPLENVETTGQGSAAYHPGVRRYLFLTKNELFDAPNPWGIWTLAGTWTGQNSPVQWQGGYQPGIISKDMGTDTFWFTISGQNDSPMITYRLHLGRMKMNLREVSVHSGKEMPGPFQLMQNYPNPFNQMTHISFELPCSGHVHLRIFGLSGKEVVTLFDQDMNPGEHGKIWNTTRLPSAVYWVRLDFRSADGWTDIHRSIKMTVLK